MKRHMPRHAVEQPLDQSYRLIPLTQGKVAKVDLADYDWLNQWNWCALYIKRTGRYVAVRNGGKDEGYKTIQMHCQILSTDQQVDHINLDPLDNRRSNLRVATPSQNLQNRGRQSNNKVGYKGVIYQSFFQANIKVKGRNKFLGRFKDPKDAAIAYDRAALFYFGEFARTNFPRSSYPDIAVTPPHAEGSSLA